MYLIDTNVLSEYRKGAAANAGVLQFFGNTLSNLMFLPPQVIGEIQAGIAKLRRKGDDSSMRRADVYELWLDGLIADFGDRVLTFDTEAARVWGALLSNQKKDPHMIDKQIAAIALLHGLVVVTLDNAEAFSRIHNLRVLNPFNDQTSHAQF